MEAWDFLGTIKSFHQIRHLLDLVDFLDVEREGTSCEEGIEWSLNSTLVWTSTLVDGDSTEEES